MSVGRASQVNALSSFCGSQMLPCSVYVTTIRWTIEDIVLMADTVIFPSQTKPFTH